MTRLAVSTVSLTLLLLAPGQARADYYLLNAEQVRSWIHGKERFLLVDSRTPKEYEEAHLPRAINIPTDQLRAQAARLPKDRSTHVIFYCRGSGCSLSPQAAKIAGELGYTNVSVYQAGVPDWLLKGFPVEKGPERTARN